MSQSLPKTKKYRHDIDGLRAIAVLLVIFCHMDFTLFSGGFIGVDVFFVISGFLITQIIYRELLQGTFTFSHFYLRRTKRLLPVLVVVLSCCVIAFSMTLSPNDLKKFTQSLIWVSLFAGNFYFWINHGGYFSENAKEAPLLHTWSLAIEEQFYFIWPITLLLIIYVIPKRYIPWLLLCFLAVLTFLSELALDYSIGASYYLLPTRFFELMTGSVLAVWWSRLPVPTKLLSTVAALFSISIILYLAFTLDSQSRFPGFNAFYVCLATAILLYSGQQPDNPISKLLSAKPMAFIGLISYSLYLWHWPILVWFNYRGVALSAVSQAAVFAGMLLISWLSWRFVEQPFRKKSWSLKRLTLTWLVLPLTILLVLNLATVQHQGFPSRFNNQTVKIEHALKQFSNEIRGACHSSFSQRLQQPDLNCNIGAPDGEKTGFLFGDSHANHFTGFLEVVGTKANINIIDYTMDQCPPIFGLTWGPQQLRAEACKQRNQQAADFIKQHKPDFIFLAASWPSQNSRFVFIDGSNIRDRKKIEDEVYNKLRETILFMTNLNLTPVIFQDIAYASNHDPKCSLKNVMFSRERDCRLPHNHNLMMVKIIYLLEAEFPNLAVIDAKQFYCNGDFCETDLEGMPLYRDNDHLNHQASKLLGSLFMSSKQSIFQKED